MAIPSFFLQAENLSKIFFRGSGNEILFHNVNYCFKQGTSYALTGISGAGKSTLLHVLAGLEQPTDGSVRISASHDTQDRENNILDKHLSLIFQVPHLIDELTLCENIMIKGLIAREKYYAANERALQLLKDVGLSHKALSRPRSLSGGEQQRVSIARALFSKPSFLLADEPTAHLDESTAAEVHALLRFFQKEYSMGLIVASHDSTLTQALDVSLELSQGILKEKPRSSDASLEYDTPVTHVGEEVNA